MLSIWSCLKICRFVKSQFFTTQSRLLTTQGKKPFENIVGKGENAGNQHFLLFPQFSTLSKTNPIISATPKTSALALNLDIPKIVMFGKELSQGELDSNS